MKRQHKYLLTIAIISIVAVSNFLIYHHLYSNVQKTPIYTTLSREKSIEKSEDAEQVFNAMIEENGTIMVEKNGYRILNYGTETHPIWFIKWWEWDTYYEETTYPDRAIAFFMWSFQFFVFLIFIFSVSRKVGHTEKSVSINS